MILRHWKALLAAACLFITGIAVGVLGTVGFGMKQLRTLLREPAAIQARADRGLGRIEKRLVTELELDAKQQAMIHREFARTAAELREQRAETMQRTRRTIGATLRRIGAQLPPEKRAEFRRKVRARLDRLGMEIDTTADEERNAPASD